MSYIHIRLSPQPDLASSSALYTDMGEKNFYRYDSLLIIHALHTQSVDRLHHSVNITQVLG